jgi:hypothetical protein
MKQISEKDLNWLFYDSEEEQIIAKLTNEENKFKNFILNIKSLKQKTNENIIFTSIILELQKETSDIKYELLKNISDNQLERLYILDKKYELLYNHYYELRTKQKRRDMLNINKTDIIRTILQGYNENYKNLIKKLILDDNNNSEEKYRFIYECKLKIEEKGYYTYNDEIKNLTKLYIQNYL